jgi:hypothetical protein
MHGSRLRTALIIGMALGGPCSMAATPRRRPRRVARTRITGGNTTVPTTVALQPARPNQQGQRRASSRRLDSPGG